MHRWSFLALAIAAGWAAACGGDDNDAPVDPGAMLTPPSSNMAAGAAAPPTSPGDTNNPPAAMPMEEPADPGGQTPSEPADNPAEPGDTPVTMDAVPFAQVPAQCRGLEVVGMQYSPGGTTLPNTCAPFHTTLNNPYAIRCIDADPNYDSGWPGDDMCILPPDPALGTQVRVAPTSYENPESGFVMQPGDEITNTYYTNAVNEEEHSFYRVNLRMRAGSHHMINRMLDADRDDGWGGGDFGGGIGGGAGSRGFPGSQRPDQDRPSGTLEVPPENAGLGDSLMAKQQFSLQLHHFNLGDKPTLREVWVNIWYKPESEVTERIGSIAMFGNPADVAVPAGEHRELHYSCDVTGSTRIITLNGHRHAHTERFGVWLERPSGETVPIYESFDYNDMPTYQYDSISNNPVPDMANRVDGAFTGMLQVERGDQIHFVCDINNTSNNNLRFANEVQTGEMCILFGTRTGDSLCGQGTRVR